MNSSPPGGKKTGSTTTSLTRTGHEGKPPSRLRPRTLAAVLAEQGTLPPAEALALIRRLAEQLDALHHAGTLHRAIQPETVNIDDARRPFLSSPPEVGLLGGSGPEEEFTPPECRDAGSLEVPAGMDAAQAVLAAAGLNLDPRRIDLYQLGALLCRLLTGAAPQAYWRSPRTKGQVPPPLRPLLERTLGFNAADRLHTIEEFLRALEATDGQAGASPGAAPADAASSRTGAWAEGTSETPRQALTAVGNTALSEQPTAALPPSAEPAPAPGGGLPFSQLGHYRVLGRLGRGGMGQVYQGYEPLLDRTVALKVLPRELAEAEDFVQCFHNEARAVARLDHPHIVRHITEIVLQNLIPRLS